MSDTPTSSMFSEQPDEELAAYRGVSVLAVIGLLVALASVAAILGPLLWPVPFVGVVLSAVALGRIQRADPKPLGRSVALVALFTSVLFAAAAPSYYFFRQQRVRQQGEIVAEEWFTLLRRRQYATALELSVPPAQRKPLDDRLNKLYETDEDRHAKLEDFVGNPQHPLVPTLTTLMQHRARVRFYDLQSYETSVGSDRLGMIYAVTFEEEGKTKSFFVRLTIVRSDDPFSARGQWQITGWEGPVKL